MERRISAILAADVAEYTRLMEANEEGTHARLMHFRTAVIDPTVERSGGRVVKNTAIPCSFRIPTTQPAQQQPAMPAEASALAAVESDSDVKSDVFGIRIGPDKDTLMEAAAEVAAQTNQAIVDEGSNTWCCC